MEGKVLRAPAAVVGAGKEGEGPGAGCSAKCAGVVLYCLGTGFILGAACVL